MRYGLLHRIPRPTTPAANNPEERMGPESTRLSAGGETGRFLPEEMRRGEPMAS